MQRTAEQWLGRAAIAGIVILLTLISATALVLSNPSWRDRIRRQAGWVTEFSVGAPSGLPTAWHQRTTPTVVIFVSSTCVACRQSLPFHRELRSAITAAGLGAVTALTSAQDDTATYAANESLPLTDVVRFDAVGSRLRVVPTILILDSRGSVLEKKEGVLSPEEQHALMATLRRVSSRPAGAPATSPAYLP
jgi:hypothetical protein